jgi:hypothetical protein
MDSIFNKLETNFLLSEDLYETVAKSSFNFFRIFMFLDAFYVQICSITSVMNLEVII